MLNAKTLQLPAAALLLLASATAQAGESPVMKLAGADAEGCNFAATNVTPGETFPHAARVTTVTQSDFSGSLTLAHPVTFQFNGSEMTVIENRPTLANGTGPNGTISAAIAAADFPPERAHPLAARLRQICLNK